MTPANHPAAGLEPRREVLDNGAVFLWSERRDTPAVAIRGLLPAGAAREAVEQLGLAGFAARMLRRGTERRSAHEISTAVEDVGASFSVWGGTEESGFSARCLAADLGVVLDILREVLERPSFPEEEMQRVRAEIGTQLRERDDSTRAQAELAAYASLYPADHPYSRSPLGTEETVAALSREDLRAFHRAYYAAPGLRVSIAGAVDVDLARRHLSGWFPGRRAAGPLPDLRGPAFGPPQDLRLPMPHKSQVDLLLLGPGIPRDHPDYYALSMASLILGGLGLMGRLGERIRDGQGLAYHASCRAVCRLWAGEWVASAGVAPEHVDHTAAAIRAEVARMREEPVTEQELADARDYLIGSMPLRLETSEGIAAYLLNCEYYGLGLDYLHRYPDLIRAETRESLRAAMQRHLLPDRLTLAAAGPGL